MALTQDRSLDSKLSPRPARYGYSVQAGFKVWRGSIVAVCQDETIIPAGAVGTPVAVKIAGIASHQQDNTANAIPSALTGSEPVDVYRGVWALPFDVAPVGTNIGAAVYAVDDQTVSLSSNSNARLQVGTLDGFDERGIPYTAI